MKSFRDEFKNKFLDWLKESTSHGLPKIVKGKNIFKRVTWLLFFLASFSYCTFAIVRIILDFYKYDTTISINKVQEMSVTFPAVTFCNINAFNERNLVDILATYNSIVYWDCLEKAALNRSAVSVCNRIERERRDTLNLHSECVNQIQVQIQGCRIILDEFMNALTQYWNCTASLNCSNNVDDVNRIYLQLRTKCLIPKIGPFPNCDQLNSNALSFNFNMTTITDCSANITCPVYDTTSNYITCLQTESDTNPYLTLEDGRCDEILQALDYNIYTSISESSDDLKRVYLNRMRQNESINEQIGFDIKRDLLISCRYNARKCDERNFTKVWNNMHGFCYTFNGGGTLLNATEGAIHDGLQLELVTSKAAFRHVRFYTNSCLLDPPNIDIKHSSKSGIFLMIHNQSVLPSTLNEGIEIPTGFEVNVAVDRVFNYKREYPYSNCMEDLKSDSNPIIFQYFKDLGVAHYDQRLCLSLCSQDKLIDECGCVDIVTPAIRNKTYCALNANLTKETRCMKNFQAKFPRSDFIKTCARVCPQACNTIDYGYQMSMSTFPNVNYIKHLMSTDKAYLLQIKLNSTNLYLESVGRKSILKVKVNYASFYYTTIQEQPAITREELFGNIGGNLGFFIGISVLSFCEILELLVDYVLLVRKYMSKEKVKDIERRKLHIHCEWVSDRTLPRKEAKTVVGAFGNESHYEDLNVFY